MFQTLDQGISFVENLELHHFNSIGDHLIVRNLTTSKAYYLNDQLYATHNLVMTSLKVYFGEKVVFTGTG